jgi:sulfopyruvate decarboxylase alpha subunit
MNGQCYNQLDTKGNPHADQLHNLLKASGVDFATGIPCGVQRHIIHNLTNDPEVLHVPCTRESEAVGIAAGAFLAGRCPVVYMQNSGFFAASNDIASLLIACRIPILFTISWRGCPGENAVQHQVTGRATQTLLVTFGMHWHHMDGRNLKEAVDGAFAAMSNTSLPAALLLSRGWCT